jgi:hypothetical protein
MAQIFRIIVLSRCTKSKQSDDYRPYFDEVRPVGGRRPSLPLGHYQTFPVALVMGLNMQGPQIVVLLIIRRH